MGLNEDTSVREVWAFLAELLKDETIPEPRRKRAAELLIGAGWIALFDGAVDAAVKLLGQKPQTPVINTFYDGNDDGFLDDRV